MDNSMEFDNTLFQRVWIFIDEATECLNNGNFSSECNYDKATNAVDIVADAIGLKKLAYMCACLACTGKSGETIFLNADNFFSNKVGKLCIIKDGYECAETKQVGCRKAITLFIPDLDKNGYYTNICSESDDPDATSPMTCSYSEMKDIVEIKATHEGLLDFAIACLQLANSEKTLYHTHFDQWTYFSEKCTEISLVKKTVNQ